VQLQPWLQVLPSQLPLRELLRVLLLLPFLWASQRVSQAQVRLFLGP
jgi:hypothetical protein